MLKHYMHNGSSIYQTKYCQTTFSALPRIAYIVFSRPVVGKITSLRQKSQQTHHYRTCKSISIFVVAVSV